VAHSRPEAGRIIKLIGSLVKVFEEWIAGHEV
jgi:hypothetical protein